MLTRLGIPSLIPSQPLSPHFPLSILNIEYRFGQAHGSLQRVASKYNEPAEFLDSSAVSPRQHLIFKIMQIGGIKDGFSNFYITFAPAMLCNVNSPISWSQVHTRSPNSIAHHPPPNFRVQPTHSPAPRTQQRPSGLNDFTQSGATLTGPVSERPPRCGENSMTC